ncbi:MAG: hypothetical protein Q9168_005064 [Polycauliona sp. 1 TL-2023]
MTTMMTKVDPLVTIGLEDLAQYLSATSRDNWYLIDLPIETLAKDSSQNLMKLGLIREDAEQRALKGASYGYALKGRILSLKEHDGALEEFWSHKQAMVGTLRAALRKQDVSLVERLNHLADRIDHVQVKVSEEPSPTSRQLKLAQPSSRLSNVEIATRRCSHAHWGLWTSVSLRAEGSLCRGSMSLGDRLLRGLLK